MGPWWISRSGNIERYVRAFTVAFVDEVFLTGCIRDALNEARVSLEDSVLSHFVKRVVREVHQAEALVLHSQTRLSPPGRASGQERM